MARAYISRASLLEDILLQCTRQRSHWTTALTSGAAGNPFGHLVFKTFRWLPLIF